jgi:hypothetical protein
MPGMVVMVITMEWLEESGDRAITRTARLMPWLVAESINPNQKKK